MSTTTICRDAFDYGQDLRRQPPLNSGRCNIEEVAKWLSDMRQTLDGIAEITCRRGFYPKRTHLPCCLPSERAIFLKSVPQRICLLLGHDILPSIAALHGDGVSAGESRPSRLLLTVWQMGSSGPPKVPMICSKVEDLIRAALEAVPAQPA